MWSECCLILSWKLLNLLRSLAPSTHSATDRKTLKWPTGARLLIAVISSSPVGEQTQQPCIDTLLLSCRGRLCCVSLTYYQPAFIISPSDQMIVDMCSASPRLLLPYRLHPSSSIRRDVSETTRVICAACCSDKQSRSDVVNIIYSVLLDLNPFCTSGSFHEVSSAGSSFCFRQICSWFLRLCLNKPSPGVPGPSWFSFSPVDSSIRPVLWCWREVLSRCARSSPISCVLFAFQLFLLCDLPELAGLFTGCVSSVCLGKVCILLVAAFVLLHVSAP